MPPALKSEFISYWNDHSPFFSPEEIFSPSTRGYWHLVDLPALQKLNDFRKHLDVVLLCNFGPHKRRGVRSPQDQRDLEREVKSAAQFSMHVQGKAFDLSSPTLSVPQLAAAAISYGWPSVGVYPNFVHVDDRSIFTSKQNIFYRR
jgi:hypothetical protein